MPTAPLTVFDSLLIPCRVRLTRSAKWRRVAEFIAAGEAGDVLLAAPLPATREKPGLIHSAE